MASDAAKQTNDATSTVPVVDLARFINATTPNARLKAAQELVQACRDVGFVLILNHGVPQETLNEAFQISKKFFDLPLEDKMKAPHPPGFAHHRGYSRPGLEKAYGNGDLDANGEWTKEKLREVEDAKESYEVGSEDFDEQPNIWIPDDVLPEWRPFMTSFYWTCFEPAKQILRALALGIGLKNEDELVKHHTGRCNQLRLLHYPPIPAAEIEGGKYERMPAHTDYGTVTILFQDDCGGLQVEDPQHPGQFIDVPYIPGTMVMNVGDLLMRWSNDYLRSTSHRVKLPPLQDRFTGDNRLTRARYSIPYFLTTDPDFRIECLQFDDEHPPKYEPVTFREYAVMRASLAY